MLDNTKKIIHDITGIALRFNFPFEYYGNVFKLTINYIPAIVTVHQVILEVEGAKDRLKELLSTLKAIESNSSIN